jgi:hypothetical protein
MAQPTAYPNGALVTSTTTESGFTIKGSWDMSPVRLALTLVSGSVQVGVSDQTDVFTPIINVGVTHTTWSTAGDRFFITFDPVVEEVRIKGTGTVAINW